MAASWVIECIQGSRRNVVPSECGLGQHGASGSIHQADCIALTIDQQHAFIERVRSDTVEQPEPLKLDGAHQGITTAPMQHRDARSDRQCAKYTERSLPS